MTVSDYCTMRCANCSFTDGLCYMSYPPRYRCTFTGEYYDGFHGCHLDIAPVVHATWYVGPGYIDYMDRDMPSYICSNCEYESEYKSSYCPGCGANMDLEE